MKIEEMLACDGLHGLGAGYAWGKANIKSGENLNGEDSYCAKCPLHAQCWQKHRTKCRLMFPKASKAFDELLAKIKDQGQAMSIWQAKHRISDPYALQMMANIEDGMLLGQGKPVKERGRWTLKKYGGSE